MIIFITNITLVDVGWKTWMKQYIEITENGKAGSKWVDDMSLPTGIRNWVMIINTLIEIEPGVSGAAESPPPVLINCQVPGGRIYVFLGPLYNFVKDAGEIMHTQPIRSVDSI